MTIILEGKKISNIIKDEVKNKIDLLSFTPGLAIILIGQRSDSELYVKMKKKACNYVGIKNFDVSFPESVDETTILNCIETMNLNHNVHGILIQLPLPEHLNTQNILNKVSSHKDVDGFSVINSGNLTLNIPSTYPCTPVGCIELLDRYNISLEGKNAVIIGASNIVGLPLSLMLLHREATPTICHIKTKNLIEHTKRADIIFACCGCMEMIKSDWVSDGVIIIDIGIHKKDKKCVGDVDYNDIMNSNKCAAITPVPGGIGPMTVATLMKNTLQCALALQCEKEKECCL